MAARSVLLGLSCSEEKLHWLSGFLCPVRQACCRFLLYLLCVFNQHSLKVFIWSILSCILAISQSFFETTGKDFRKPKVYQHTQEMSLLVGFILYQSFAIPSCRRDELDRGILVSSLRRPPIPFADYSPLQANERSPLPSPLGSSLCWWPPAALHGSESRQLTATLGHEQPMQAWQQQVCSAAYSGRRRDCGQGLLRPNPLWRA